jgi:hypothetical protein
MRRARGLSDRARRLFSPSLSTTTLFSGRSSRRCKTGSADALAAVGRVSASTIPCRPQSIPTIPIDHWESAHLPTETEARKRARSTRKRNFVHSVASLPIADLAHSLFNNHRGADSGVRRAELRRAASKERNRFTPRCHGTNPRCRSNLPL